MELKGPGISGPASLNIIVEVRWRSVDGWRVGIHGSSSGTVVVCIARIICGQGVAGIACNVFEADPPNDSRSGRTCPLRLLS